MVLRSKRLPGLTRPKHPQYFDIAGGCVQTRVRTDNINDAVSLGREFAMARMFAECE